MGKQIMSKKTAPKIAFNSGEFVVYPAHGVGKVADISKQKIGGTELELIVVNFDRDKMTLRVPLSKAESIGLRKISETSTMNEALGVLKGKAIPEDRLRAMPSAVLCIDCKSAEEKRRKA